MHYRDAAHPRASELSGVVCLQVEMLSPSPVTCPISLYSPICPQITPCGHVFSFPAIMQVPGAPPSLLLCRLKYCTMLHCCNAWVYPCSAPSPTSSQGSLVHPQQFSMRYTMQTTTWGVDCFLSTQSPPPPPQLLTP